MRTRLLGLVLVAGLAVTAAPGVHAALPQAPAGAAATLPPVLYTCPMHPDVLEEKPGQCPVCQMTLEPIRIDSKWWCPVHQTLEVHDAPGKCRRDGRDLVQVTLREYWTCRGSNNQLLDPGTCADGQPRKIAYELRAHGNHNPQHGGQFFMAEDQWHHLEGTYPSAGLFRVYFYDNFTKPMDAKEFTGSFLILDDAFKEVASYPLKLGADGKTMEAHIPADKAVLPLNGAARISFGPGKKPNLFNFPFKQYTKDPGTPTGAVTVPSKPRASNIERQPALLASGFEVRRPFSFRMLAVAQAPSQAPSVSTAAPDQAPRILDSPLQISAALANALDEDKLPKDTPGLVAELSRRQKEIDDLVKSGELGQAWLPAMGTKTVALVLEERAQTLSPRQQEIAAAATRRVITAAWEIDAYGDLGNLPKILESYERMSSAVADLKGVYAPAR